MKRFAIALTALAAICAASSVIAQSSVLDQMRAQRERRAGKPAAATAPVAGGEQALGQAAGEQALGDAQVMALAKDRNCMSCHGIDEKFIGPTFKEIAAKYEYSVDDIVRLMNSIREGSKGVWGTSLTMPANQRMSKEEAQRIATWILRMK